MTTQNPATKSIAAIQDNFFHAVVKDTLHKGKTLSPEERDSVVQAKSLELLNKRIPARDIQTARQAFMDRSFK